MLKVIDKSSAQKFHRELKRVLRNASSETLTRNLTTPGGLTHNAKIYWNESNDLWAYFSEKPEGDNHRWLCWFGSTLRGPNELMSPSVEINLALNPTYKQIAGRMLMDNKGNFYLGHKGGLGGGRGGQLKISDFAASISGFVQETIFRSDPATGSNLQAENVFIFGKLHNNDFISRVAEYVRECERLRAMARAGSQIKALDAPSLGTSFSPENAADGTGNGHPNTEYEIKRIHGRVVNALQAKLKKLKFNAGNSKNSNMFPDLHIKDKSGNMQILFEVKASSDTQSWFTGIGQLIVYSAHEGHVPLRILVCPAPRKDPNFNSALQVHGILLLLFKERGSKYEFPGLSSILSEMHK